MLDISEVLCSLLTVQPKTQELPQPHFLLLPPPQGHHLLVQLGLAQGLQVHPKSLPDLAGPPASSELGAADPPREPDRLWPARRPGLAHGGLFQHPDGGAWAPRSASTGPATCLSSNFALCHGRDLGNNGGKCGQQDPTVHMAMRRALWASHGSSKLHLFRPQTTPNFLHIPCFSTTTMCFPKTGRVLQLVL